jgi:hypothetical protein
MTSVMTRSLLQRWHRKLHIAGHIGSFTNLQRHVSNLAAAGTLKDRAAKWRWQPSSESTVITVRRLAPISKIGGVGNASLSSIVIRGASGLRYRHAGFVG